MWYGRATWNLTSETSLVTGHEIQSRPDLLKYMQNVNFPVLTNPAYYSQGQQRLEYGGRRYRTQAAYSPTI